MGREGKTNAVVNAGSQIIGGVGDVGRVAEQDDGND